MGVSYRLSRGLSIQGIKMANESIVNLALIGAASIFVVLLVYLLCKFLSRRAAKKPALKAGRFEHGPRSRGGIEPRRSTRFARGQRPVGGETRPLGSSP